jgi:hypothetical protein
LGSNASHFKRKVVKGAKWQSKELKWEKGTKVAEYWQKEQTAESKNFHGEKKSENFFQS